jgi:hypothetical protein
MIFVRCTNINRYLRNYQDCLTLGVAWNCFWQFFQMAVRKHGYYPIAIVWPQDLLLNASRDATSNLFYEVIKVEDRTIMTRQPELQLPSGLLECQKVRKDLKGPERTWKDLKGPERTWKDLKGPERTWKDLKGPDRTWKDLKGPERTWKDLKGPERT